MTQKLPWILVAILGAALLYMHMSHGEQIDQLNRSLSGNQSVHMAGTGDDNDGPALLSRITLLESQVADLKARRKGRAGPGGLLGARRAATGAGAGQASMLEARAAGRTGEQVLEVLESDNPEVRSRLHDVIDEELSNRRERRRDERRERRAAETEQMVQDMTREYALSGSQSTSLRDLLSDEQEQIREFFQAARQDHSWGEARDKAQDLREDNDAEVMDLLSEQAYESWQAKRDAEIERYYGRRRQ